MRVFLGALYFAVIASNAEALPQRRLAVLPSIVQGESGKTQTQLLFDELSKSAELRVGLDLVEYNELFVDGAEPIASTVLGCGSDLTCISRALRNVRIELCLRAIVNFAVSPPLVSLSLIEGPGERILAEQLVEVESEKLAAKLQHAGDLLFDSAGFNKGGRLVVTTEPSDAKISARNCTTGQLLSPDSREAAQFTVPPGCVELDAVRDGYQKTAARAEVRLGETTPVTLSLTANAPDSEDSLFASPWFWIVAGGLVAAGTTAVLVATDPFSDGTPAPTCFCVATPDAPCPPCP